MPNKPSQSGALRHRVAIWNVNATADDSGQEREQPILMIANVPAGIRSVGGGERQAHNQLLADTTHLVRTRFLRECETLPSMFMTRQVEPPKDGKVVRYDVMRTTDPDGMRRWMDHQVKQLPLEGERE